MNTLALRQTKAKLQPTRDRLVKDIVVPGPFASLKRFVPLLVPLAILSFWQAASSGGALSSTILPAPLDVARAFLRLLLSGELAENAAISFLRALSGLRRNTPSVSSGPAPVPAPQSAWLRVCWKHRHVRVRLTSVFSSRVNAAWGSAREHGCDHDTGGGEYSLSRCRCSQR